MWSLQASLNAFPPVSSSLLVTSRAGFAGLMYASAYNDMVGKQDILYVPALYYLCAYIHTCLNPAISCLTMEGVNNSNVGVNTLELLQTLSVDENTPGKSNGPQSSSS